MRPTEMLMNEHRVIEQVLSCLEKMTERAASEGRLDWMAAKAAVDFFRVFADRCHHRKEESHLFPMLEARGFSRQSGPTGMMIYEHQLGREHVGGMSEALGAASRGHADALQRFARHARAYVQLLREHIQKEDHCLFPMANQAMTEPDQVALATSFAKVESEQMERGTHERFLKIADELADKFGVPKVAEVCKHSSRKGD